MLTPVGPDQLLTAWSADPVVVGGLLAAAATYATGLRRGPRRPPRWRTAAFAGGLLAIAVALTSPLEALAGTLLSAHMAQHLLLALVAAPALAVSAPGEVLQRGSPPRLRRRIAALRGRSGMGTGRSRAVWGPWAAWLLHVGVMWLWHARALHEAALRADVVHALEHATILGAALVLWALIAGARGARQIDRGQAVLVVFASGVQGVLLAALLVFARQPWYAAYGDGPSVWGMSALGDQQLAGALLSATGTVVHLAAALVLLGTWFREVDRRAVARGA